MKKIIKKGTEIIYILYRGNPTPDTLFGNNFSLDESEETLCFEIDLSSNLRVRNRSQNNYSDAKKLIENNVDLESIQIDDDAIIRNLATAHKKFRNAAWRVRLKFSETEELLYPVNPNEISGSLFLEIITP